MDVGPTSFQSFRGFCYVCYTKCLGHTRARLCVDKMSLHSTRYQLSFIVCLLSQSDKQWRQLSEFSTTAVKDGLNDKCSLTELHFKDLAYNSKKPRWGQWAVLSCLSVFKTLLLEVSVLWLLHVHTSFTIAYFLLTIYHWSCFINTD